MEEDDFISKTQRKKQMKALQDVGSSLVKLSAEQLARLDLPEQLRDAVLACKGFTRHEAIRRQMQYIGRIMRKVDSAPILEQVARLESPTRRDTALFHAAEKWRQELLEQDDAVARFVQEFPEADPQRLRDLIDGARAEKRGTRPPRSSRELFHVLNAIVQGHARRQP
ncbi:MAG TPA: ribosome biogenesis factor YjgA [Usitatibacter sp.]|nr:ribosome biogenesis factor YjgA [Usitatibacter sp.]